MEMNRYARSTLVAALLLCGGLVLGLSPAAPNPAAAADEGAAGAALLDGYIAAFNTHDVDAFKGIIADGYIQHNGRSGPGLAGLQATVKQYLATFADFHVRLDDRIISGDKVVARFTFTATHDRPVQLGPGAPAFPPTGKKLSWGGISIWRVADGKFLEHWDEDDLAGLARQMRSDSPATGRGG